MKETDRVKVKSFREYFSQDSFLGNLLEDGYTRPRDNQDIWGKGSATNMFEQIGQIGQKLEGMLVKEQNVNIFCFNNEGATEPPAVKGRKDHQLTTEL